MLKINLQTFSDAAARQVFNTGARIVPELAIAATTLVSNSLRDLQLREPKADKLELFRRVIATHPGAAGVLWASHAHGAAEAEEVAEDYEVEGAA